MPNGVFTPGARLHYDQTFLNPSGVAAHSWESRNAIAALS